MICWKCDDGFFLMMHYSDVTRERISRILELIEILLSTQTGFSLVNAAVVCAILDSCLDYSHWYILWCCTDFSQCYILLCYIALTIATDTIILLRCLDYSQCYILSYRCDYSQCCTLLYCLYYSHWKSLLFCLVYSNPSAQRFRGHVERQIIIIITYSYNALNDALSASRLHNKLKTILSKYIHIQNRQS